MKNTPASSVPPSTPAGSATQPISHYNSAYVQIETFIFNPTLVTGFLHRAATSDESVAVTDVLYGSHHLTVEDKEQQLFHFLCRQLSPSKPATTI